MKIKFRVRRVFRIERENWTNRNCNQDPRKVTYKILLILNLFKNNC